LDNFDLPLYKQQKENQSVAASSTIKKNIRQAIKDGVNKEGQS